MTDRIRTTDLIKAIKAPARAARAEDSARYTLSRQLGLSFAPTRWSDKKSRVVGTLKLADGNPEYLDADAVRRAAEEIPAGRDYDDLRNAVSTLLDGNTEGRQTVTPARPDRFGRYVVTAEATLDTNQLRSIGINDPSRTGNFSYAGVTGRVTNIRPA